MRFSRRNFIANTTKVALLLTGGGALRLLHAPLNGADLLGSKIELRFAIFSDGHYGQPNTAYEQFHTDMINWINEEHKKHNLDFVVINGDLFHDDPVYLPLLLQQLKRLQMPWFATHGNHDMIDEESWIKFLGYPYNYVIRKKDAAFMFLNTADENGNYIKADYEWVKAQFNNELKKVKHVFVFMHITPFNWTKAGFAFPELADLFSKQPNLRAIFHGHDHEEDGYKEFGGKYYFFNGHVGGNWGLPYHGYRMVEMNGKGDLITYQMNPKENVILNSKEI